MFLSEWREFPSAPCLAGKKNLMTARVSMLLKSRASLTCFRPCFLPGRAYQHSGNSLSRAEIHLLGQQYAMVCGNRLPPAGLTKVRRFTLVTSLKGCAPSHYDSFKPHCDTVKSVLKGTWRDRKPVSMGKLSQSRRSVL